MPEFAWKEGDTSPVQTVRLSGRDGLAADLTGATVVMHANNEAISCTVVDAPAGLVRPGRGSLTAAGRRLARYAVEFQVTFAGGQIQTFPEEGSETLTVHAQLDPEVPA
jgi:hypothetical protein